LNLQCRIAVEGKKKFIYFAHLFQNMPYSYVLPFLGFVIREPETPSMLMGIQNSKTMELEIFKQKIETSIEFLQLYTLQSWL